MKSKRFSRKWTIVTASVAMLSSLSLGIFVGCGGEETPEPPAKGIGVFYFDAGLEEYQLSLGDGYKLTYLANGESKTGVYQINERGIVITFDGEEGETIATLENGILTWDYNDSQMRFYQKVYYTVSYDEMGGGEVADTSVINGKTVKKPADPVRVGYEFLGWYIDNTYKTPYMFDTQIVTSNITLYAQWALTDASKATYTVDFDLGYEAEGVVAPKAMTTYAGKLYNVPNVEREGYNFCGWWISDYEDAEKLTYKYTDDTVFTANTTLFAVWESKDLGSKAAAPSVEVVGNLIKWNAVKGGRGVYTLKVKGPDGFLAINEDVSKTSYVVDFDAAPAGDYVIEVTAHAYVPENNSETVVRAYRNKPVGRVSQFSVLDGRVLLFNRVEKAETYYITVDCGNEAHTHTMYNNGDSTYYNFANCEMQEGGIKFTVTAAARGYASVQSETFVYNRILDKVEGLSINEATQMISWYPVKDATNYIVSIACGDATHVHEYVNVGSKTSYSLKECAPVEDGDIVINVFAQTNGYNSPEATQLTYKKTKLASPRNIAVANTAEGFMLTWNSVAGATGYSVKIDNVVLETTTNSCNLTDAVAWVEGMDYQVEVKAKNDTNESVWSDPIPVRYYNLAENLKYKEGIVSWDPVMGATAYEVKVNDGVVQTVTDSFASIELTQAGTNMVRVRFIDEKNNYYSQEWAVLEITDVQEIIFDSRGGSAVAPQYKVTGDALTLPRPEREGYDFVGWYNTPRGPESNGSKYEDGYFTENQELVLYAYWKPATFKVVYVVGEDGTMDEVSGEVCYTKDYKLDVPVVDDGTKVFLGWFAGSGATSEQLTDDRGYSIKPWALKQGATVYAQYVKNVLSFTLLQDDTYSVMRGINATKVTSITIPEKYNGKDVTVVDGNAFQNCTKLVSVNIPDTIKLISEETAFMGCKRLEEINIIETGNKLAVYSSVDGVLIYKNDLTGAVELSYFPLGKKGAYSIPEGVTEIPLRTFEGTQVTEVTIPTTVTVIREKAFYGCSTIEKISFAEGGTDGLVIEDGAFQKCSNLSVITLPARLTELQVNAETHTLTLFTGCDQLTHINIERGNQIYSSIDGVITDKNGQLIYCPAARKGVYEIPMGITSVAPYAFFECNKLTQVIIPGYVETIGDYAFANCAKISRIVFSGGAVMGMKTDVGAYVFADNANLREIVFEKGSVVNSFGERAFANVKALSKITLPTTLTYVGDYAFENAASLSTVEFENGDKGSLEFGNYVFSECKNLTTVILPKSVTKLNLGVFDGCVNISAILVDDSNTMYKDIDGVVFTKDGKELVFFPKGMRTENGEYDIPAGVEMISEGAFKGMRYIEKIEIDNTITYIGKYAFENSQSLSSLTFAEGNDDMKLAIDESAFAGCAAITTVELPARTQKIAARAFYNVSMSAVSFPAGLEEIGDYAFAKTSLRSVEIPQSVSVFGESVFMDCKRLTEASFAQGYTGTIIPVGIFKGTNITSINIPGSIEKIGYEAFNDCAELTTVIFEDGTAPLEIGALKEGGVGVFLNCKKIERLTIPNRTTYIGENAFSGCSLLTDVGLNSDSQLQRIGPSAFDGCSSLARIYIPNTVANTPYVDENTSQEYAIGRWAFANSGITEIIFEEGGEGEFSIAREALRNSGRIVGYDPKYNTAIYESMKVINLPARLAPIYVLEGSMPMTYEGFNDDVTNGALEIINVEEGGKYYSSINGVLFKLTEKDGEYVEDIMLYSTPYNTNTSITIPWTVSKIGDYAAREWTALQKLVFEDTPEGVEKIELTIGNNAFYYCSGLTQIILPERLGTLGKYAFASCSGATKVQLPSTLHTMVSDGFNPGERTGYQFQSCSGLTEVIFAEDGQLKELAGAAFQSCSKLTTLNIPAYIEVIGANAFNGCSNVTTLTFGTEDEPSRLHTIGNKAFTGMTLTSLELPDSITTLKSNTFGTMKQLTYLKLPASLNSISATITNGQVDFLFQNLSAITHVDVSEANPYYASRDGVVYTKAVQPDGTVVYPELVYYPKMKPIDSTPETTTPDGKYTTPAGVTSIGAYAFYQNTKLKQLVLSKDVISVAAYAFSSCTQMTSFTVETEGRLAPITFGDYVFRSNTRLTGTLTIPSQVVLAGKNIFQSTRYSKIVFEPGNESTSLDQTFFGNSSLTSVENIPTTLASMNQTFRDCKNLATVTFDEQRNSMISSMLGTFFGCTALKHIDLPNVGSLMNVNVVTSTWNAEGSVYTGVFEGCTNLETVKMKDCGVIGASTFKDCPKFVGSYEVDEEGNRTGKTYFQIPESVMSIGEGAFYNCSALKEVRFPSGIEVIPLRSFHNCTALTTVDIPDFVSKIDTSAFENCTSLMNLTLGSGLITIEDRAFYGARSLGDFEFQTGIETIGEYAFYGASKLTKLDLPAGLISVGNYAFAGCSGVETLTAQEGLEEIGDFAFSGFVKVKVFNVPSTVTKFGLGVFDGWDSLQEIVIAGGNLDYAFKDGLLYNSTYTKLLYVPTSRTGEFIVPETVLELGERLFAGSQITSIVLPDTITTIPAEAFRDCRQLKSVQMPANLTSIGYAAFYGCTSLETIFIPKSVQNNTVKTLTQRDRGDGVIMDCGYYYSENVEGIGAYAFAFCTSLTNIIFEEGGVGRMTIGNYAFFGCENLKGEYDQESGKYELRIPNRVRGDSINRNFYCEDPRMQGMQYGWWKFDQGIGIYAFAKCNSLQSVIFEEEGVVTYSEPLLILVGAFAECNSLESVTFNEALADYIMSSKNEKGGLSTYGTVAIQARAFVDCANLVEVNFPKDMSKFSAVQDAFEGTSCKLPAELNMVKGSSYVDYGDGRPNYETGTDKNLQKRTENNRENYGCSCKDSACPFKNPYDI